MIVKYISGEAEVVDKLDEIDYEVEIYIIGGYDRLINKLRAKFVNMASDGICR